MGFTPTVPPQFPGYLSDDSVGTCCERADIRFIGRTHLSTRLGLFLYSRGMLAASSLRLLVTPISFVLWIPTWPNMLNDAQG
jgi:hypothetical protein